jgi:two-component system, NarL family, nitrate/nitrite response regulator NarL
MSEPIRVVIFDGYSLFRRGVVDALSGTNLLVVAEDDTMEMAAELIAKAKPNIVLFDISESESAGRIGSLLNRFPRSRFVIFTASQDREYIEEVWQAGVHGCILKGVGATELIRALQGVHNGQPYVSATLATMLLKKEVPRRTVPPRDNFSALTNLDKQILAHLAEGLTNPQIAARLGLTVKIVKRHLSSVFRKLHVSNRVQAALHAKKHARELGI